MAAASVTRPRGSVEFRRVRGLAHPPLRDLFEFARFFEPFDRTVDAVRERRFFGQQRAPFFAFGVAELADDDGVFDLRFGQVERRRQVDHDRFDLAVLERRDDVTRAVEDFRFARRFDEFFDRFEAGGVDLHAELRCLQFGQRFGFRRFRAFQRDDRLLGGVVRRREVDRLFAHRRDRDLVQVEVEVLRARRVRGVERLDRPLYLFFGVAELFADRVADGALEAFTVFRFVVFEVRRVGPFVGGDGQGFGRVRFPVRRRAGGGLRGRPFFFRGASRRGPAGALFARRFGGRFRRRRGARGTAAAG